MHKNITLKLKMYSELGMRRRQKWHIYGRKNLEMPGIEPGAFHMRSERSTTELHPLHNVKVVF